MFRFIKKKDIYPLFESGYHQKLGWNYSDIHLKTWQDMIALNILELERNKCIGEIGGGDSRILKILDSSNKLYNIEKFDGLGNGPKNRIKIKSVKNIDAYIGSKNEIPDQFFDIIFSISVIEHVAESNIIDFFEDNLRVLKSGGKCFHLIDHYISSENIENSLSLSNKRRFELYKNVLSNLPNVSFIDNEFENFHFSSDMATNPDQTMYG